MSCQQELDPFQGEAVKTGPGRELEADLLECQSVMMNLGLRPTPADLLEAAKMLREARKGAKMGLLRAWEGASQEEREWLLDAIRDGGG